MAHRLLEAGVVAFGLVAVGFCEIGERGGEGVGVADVAGDFRDVTGARMGAHQQGSATPAPKLERLVAERFDRH